MKQAVLDDLKNIAMKEKFNKLEYVKKAYLHTNMFSIENGLVTPTLKSKVNFDYRLYNSLFSLFQRFELQRYFAKIIEELYKQ